VRVYLALGSNQGAPVPNLKRALHMIAAESAVTVVARSSIYETLPVGPPGQHNYFNAVIAVDTTMEPRQLLRRLQAIETGLGRVRGKEHWIPRTMDIDILLFGDRTVVDGHLSIPHPRIAERDFVVVPLHEIAPGAAYPGGRPVVLTPGVPATILRRLDGGAWE
jgi:2-amino-4-hydroxy-6-hydroxymethyldihydropteridine diphosphokinase